MSDLNERQRLAFQKIITGKNILLTGKAGSGKSYLVTRIIDHYKRNGLKLGVSGMTGISALQIRGRTIHSLLGLGLATKSAVELYVTNRRKYPKLVRNIRDINALIIDEISMMSEDMFVKISEYLILVRGAKVPFGGLQLILCGDFCQLSPVSGTYCFKSSLWSDSNIETVELTESMRQRNDEEFRTMLDELRFGRCSKEIFERLNTLKGTVFPDGIEPTILYSRNVDVDYINTSKLVELMNLGTETHTYKAKIPNNELAKAWIDSLRIDDEIMLCEGAQVMLTINLNVETGLVNGSRGVVLETLKDSVKVRFRDGHIECIEYFVLKDDIDEELYISYIPLKLAYAISIHKSQGLTLDAVEMDLGVSIFAEGQGYTALSRARDLKSIRILAISNKAFKVNTDVLKFYEETV